MDTEKIVGDSVFTHKFLKRLARFLLVLLLLLGSQHPGCRKKVENTYHKSNQTYRKEAEESEGFKACILKSVADDKVRRRTDEGHHSTHAAGEGQRHEKAARRRARSRRHADHDRKHEGNRTCVADEHSDGRCHYHHKKEKPEFAVAGKGHHLAAYHLCQSCLEDTSSHDEQAYHHDDCSIGESCKTFRRGKYLTQKKRKKSAKGHEIGAYLAADEKYGRNKKYYKRCYHLLHY